MVDHPLLKPRVAKYLSGDEMRHEFSHTILHNQRIDVGQNKLKDQFNNLKIVNNENVAKKPEPPVQDRGLKAPSPRHSEGGKQAPQLFSKPETPKAAPPVSQPQIKQVQSRPKLIPEPAPTPVQNRIIPSQPIAKVQVAPVASSPVSRIQPSVSPKPQVAQSKEDLEARQRQAAAKQQYMLHVEQMKREREQQAEARRRRDQEDLDKKRKDRDEEERRKAKLLQEKKAKEELIRQREREELERAKEEKKAKREQGREAMLQDIARKRNQKVQMMNKKAESPTNQVDGAIRNSSYYSNKSESEAKRPPSRGLGSRNGSVERLPSHRVVEERPSSRQSSAKKLPINKIKSEKKSIPEPVKPAAKPSDPIPKNIVKIEKPPQPTPVPPKQIVEVVQPVLKRMDSNGSRRSRGSAKHDDGSIISGLTNDRTHDRHLFEYTGTVVDPEDHPDSTGFNPPGFGKTAYFIGEQGTAGFNDFKEDIFDINKASNEINNRLFGEDPFDMETPKKSAKAAATNLDFITVPQFKPR
jgi:hypothetical protein